MKKRYAVMGSGLAAGALCMAMAMNVMAAEITKEQAQQKALENAGVKESQVAFIRAELDWEDGRKVYDVEFFTEDYKEYDYEISAADGSILSVDYDAETAFYFERGNRSNGDVSVTSDQARKTALDHAGVKEEDVPFIHVKLDYDDGLQVYDVEFYTEDGKEYDYEIDAQSGTILSWDYDAEQFSGAGSRRENGGSRAAAETSVTEEQARAKALEQAGLKDSQVTWRKLKLDYDDRRLVYEGEFISGHLEYEFEIDAASGTLVDWDVESIYD